MMHHVKIDCAGGCRMAYRILCVESRCEALDDTLAICLNPGAGFRLQRASWEHVVAEGLGRYSFDAILAVIAARAGDAAEYLRRLRQRPLAAPALAVLPEAPDEELLRCVVDAADDFTLWPLRAWELRHRLARLLGTVRVAVAGAMPSEHAALMPLVGTDPHFSRLREQLPLIAASD